MTIGKKLYVNFGAVLAMVVVLFLVNLVAVQREHSAKAAASQALQMAETHRQDPLSDDAEPALSEQLPAQRRHPRSGASERRHAHAGRQAAERREPGELGAAAGRAGAGCKAANKAGRANFPTPLIEKRKTCRQRATPR